MIAERLEADASATEAQALVADAVGADASGEAWQVAPMFGETADPELDRFLEITGTIDAHALPAGAWSLAYAVRDALRPAGRFDVVPDLPRSVFAPAERDALRVGAAQTPVTVAPLAVDANWHLTRIGTQEAWGIATRKGAGIRIGHPDTGYRFVPGLERDAYDLTSDRDVLAQDDDALDPLERGAFLHPGHGARTASVIAARDTGRSSGVAPAATLVPIRAVKSVIQTFDGDVAKAVVHATNVGCHVISMSLGGAGLSGLRAAIRAAVRSGAIVMAAGGNFEVGGFVFPYRRVVWPAAWPECLGIAATRGDDKLWVGSARGEGIDIAAPGEDIAVPDVWNPGSQTVSTGTSFAVAAVAGAAAMWLDHHRGRLSVYPPERLQPIFLSLLTEHGVDSPTGWDARGGAGILDVPALLRAPLPPSGDILESFGRIDVEAAPPTVAEDRLNRLAQALQLLPEDLDSYLPAPVTDDYAEELLYILTEQGAPVEQVLPGVRDFGLPQHASPELRRALAGIG